MAKIAIFKGKGEIEFNLPSKRNSTTLKNGESIEVVEKEDLRVVKALRSLGLLLEEVSEEEVIELGKQEEVSVKPEELEGKKENETNDVNRLQEEKKEFVKPEVEEISKPKFTFEELHSKRADELRSLVEEFGAEVQEGASKKDMANAILRKLGE